MRTVSVSDLPGVGWKLGKRLTEKGYRLCSELWTVPRPVLVEWFGPSIGSLLHCSCRGEDTRELSRLTERKSIGEQGSHRIACLTRFSIRR
jgi:nucleotidyltransferase/DNA polymerase involved in DNA repair